MLPLDQQPKKEALNFLSMNIICRVTLLFILIVPCKTVFSQNDIGDTLFQGVTFTPRTVLSSNSSSFKLMFYHFRNDIRKRLYLAITSDRLQLDGFVWVANRFEPADRNSRPRLVIDENGNMKIQQKQGPEFKIYSSGATHKINASARLLDNGNLQLREMNESGAVKQIRWQSFDYPDTILLPGMRLGVENRRVWDLKSWRGNSNLASSSFKLVMTPNTKQLAIHWQDNVYWTSEPLVGSIFSNLKTKSGGYNFHFAYIENENGAYFNYSSSDDQIHVIHLNPLGDLDGDADVSCSRENAKYVKGCVFQNPPSCRNPETYVNMMNFKLGIMSQAGYRSNETEKLSLYDCGDLCLRNCSCVAYAPTRGENERHVGCHLWGKEVKFVPKSKGKRIYFIQDKHPDPVNKWIKWVVVAAALVVLAVSVICISLRREYKTKAYAAKERLKQRKLLFLMGGIAISPIVNRKETESTNSERSSQVMRMFSFEIIAMATDNFSPENKLGQGGFGPVYKGKLPNGQEIAIKRLCRSSRQGPKQFENEVNLIAKLQHTNLVRLEGFCAEREEKMLIYEYLPNKSLDFYLFDSNNKVILNWKLRFGVIQGIAQGLVYLHDYSRLKVIHRDLKPSNILLDEKMNSKISDFGMAKIFKLKELEENTHVVAGTRGYMSPEYILNGIVSTKTDVYSFGVLLIEIVSGKKNAECYHSDYPINLTGYAWQLWNEGRALELMDMMDESKDAYDEILRCFHIGLLCVQDQAKDRPEMVDVVRFLSNEAVKLDEPKQPAFFPNIALKEDNFSDKMQEKHSINDLTISSLYGR